MDKVTRAIWAKFRVKRHDTNPMMGWTGTRNTLAELFGELGFNKGAEIGVQLGDFSEILCKANPNLHLLCVDPWESYNRMPTELAHKFYEKAKTKLAPYNAELIRKRSIDAVVDVPDSSLDFVYIDGLHEFDPVMLDLIYWSRKVRPGGIVSGHDFCHYYQGGVVDAVYAFTHAHNIYSWYITRGREPSFFWVHPGSVVRYW